MAGSARFVDLVGSCGVRAAERDRGGFCGGRCWLPRLCLVALVFPAAPADAAAWPQRTVRSVRATHSQVATLPPASSPECTDKVAAELSAGQRGSGCGEASDAARRALVRRKDAFGFVERQRVDLVALRSVLGLAIRCRRWPLRTRERNVLRHNDAAAAGCRLRRYQGEVSLTFVDSEGVRSQPLPPVSADRDGRLTLRFAELDRGLRAVGAGSLDDYQRVELGLDGWAGQVDLQRLLGFRAQWHHVWIRQGRGLPGLFAVRHPDHPGADEARELAADAELARQHRDVERVEAQTMPARAFVDRYPWSPFVDDVRAVEHPLAPAPPPRDPRLPRPSKPAATVDPAEAEAAEPAEAAGRTPR